MCDLANINLYDILGLTINASQEEIKKAYRKKALQCHPDKNPDNPKAVELFLELSKALEILTDETARAAYDKVLKAKAAAKLRHQELDDRRKKFKEELEERERIAQAAAKKYKTFDCKTAEEKLAEQVERLRKEGSKQLEEEMAFVKNQILKEQAENKQYSADISLYRLKVKWKSESSDVSNGGYTYDNLTQMFSKYGTLGVLVISKKKKGSALIEFDCPEAAVKAKQLEKGLIINPLKITWLIGEPPLPKQWSTLDFSAGPRCQEFKLNESKKSSLFPSFDSQDRSNSEKSEENISTVSVPSTEDDFETEVLQRLREVQKKKNIACEESSTNYGTTTDVT